jgi:hypothetical protein
MEYDKYGLLTDTSKINYDEDFEIFTDDKQSDEYRKYINNIYMRIMQANLSMFLEELEKKKKDEEVRYFKEKCPKVKKLWPGCCNYCKEECLYADEIDGILEDYYFNPIKCSYCYMKSLI